jgi:hypothetical protein
MDLKEIGWGRGVVGGVGLGWIHMSWDKDHCWVLVKMDMSLTAL